MSESKRHRNSSTRIKRAAGGRIQKKKRASGEHKPSSKGTGSHAGVPRKSETQALKAMKSGSSSTSSKKASSSSVKLKAVKPSSDRKSSKKQQPSGNRMRKAKVSLMIKFTIPVIILLSMVILAWGIYVRSSMMALHMNEIKKDGASNILPLSDIARKILSRKGTGENWMVEGGWLTQKRYDELKRAEGATGDGELSGQQKLNILYKAKLLEYVKYYGGTNRNEVLNVYVLDNNLKFVAGSEEFDTVNGIQIKDGSWISGVTSDIKISDNVVDVSPVKITPATVNTNDRIYKAFKFEIDVTSDTNLNLGRVVLALRADVIETERKHMTTMMAGIGAGALILAIIICLIIANTVTAPVKTLIHDMEIVSRGNLDHKTRAHSQDEIGVLAHEFNAMTAQLLVAKQAEREAQRLENELDMAREIQTRLLPPKVPHVKGFDMDATYRPAKEVGGDYYDFFPIDKHHLGIIVADVSGKSIPGAMQMATTRTILRFVAAGNTSAADTLAKTNAIVAADIKRGMFVTAFYIVLDALNKTAVCASAGHNPMVLLRANGELELINPSGIALGFDKGPIFQRTIKEQNIELGSGDRIVLYTDGVVEAMNIRNEEYTDERFYAFSKKFKNQTSTDFIKRLLADLDAHKGKAEQHDDITIVTFKVD